MRRFILCLGMLLAWPLAGQAADPAEPTSIEFGAGAWVDVDATGKAHVVEMDAPPHFKDEGQPGSLGETINARLRERIETWEFMPPTKDGVALPGKTHVSVNAAASDDGSGGLRILIKSASTGFFVTNHSLSALFANPANLSEGWFDVHFEFGPDGKVSKATLLDSKAFGGRWFGGKPDKNLRRAVIAAVMGFTAEMEWVDGQPIGGSGNLPIRLCMSEACMSAQLPDASAGQEGLVKSISAMDLRTAVAGTVL
jgi:hypothetical protein